MSRLGRGIQSTSFCCLDSGFKLQFELEFELNFFLTQKEKVMIIMIKNYLWANVELKKKLFFHDKGVKKNLRTLERTSRHSQNLYANFFKLKIDLVLL